MKRIILVDSMEPMYDGMIAELVRRTSLQEDKIIAIGMPRKYLESGWVERRFICEYLLKVHDDDMCLHFEVMADQGLIYSIKIIREFDDTHGVKYVFFDYESLKSAVHGYAPDELMLMEFSESDAESTDQFAKSYFPVLFSRNPSNYEFTMTARRNTDNLLVNTMIAKADTPDSEFILEEITDN